MAERQGTARIRVRYPEVDRMGVAHHTHHFVWFEIGRTELMRDSGIPYSRVESEGVFLPVIEARCAYRAPVRYDDRLIVRTVLEERGIARVRFSYRIEREEDGSLMATGSTTHAAVDRNGRPCRLPNSIQGLLG